VVEPFLSAIECVLGNDFRQTEIYTAEPLVSGSGAFDFAMAFEKTRRSKPPVADQITKEIV
jgi:hypothetical protein